MNVLPLNQIGFGWRSHLSALWWLFLLFRQPTQFQDALKLFPRRIQLWAGLKCYLHAIPCMFFFLLCVRLTVQTEIVELQELFEGYQRSMLLHLGIIAVGIVIGIASGTVFGIGDSLIDGVANGITLGIAFSIALGITVGIIIGIASGTVAGTTKIIAVGIIFGSALGIFLGIIFATSDRIVLRIAEEILFGIPIGIFVGIASGIVFGIPFGIFSGIAFGIAILRVFYLPVTNWMIWPKPLGKWYPWHPVVWDQMCSMPFPGLNRLLVSYFEHDPEAARNEVERLIDTYPSQRWKALQAKCAIVARDAANLSDLTQIPKQLAALPEGDQGFLRQIPKLRELAAHIAERQEQLNRAERPTIRKQFAELLRDEIESFHNKLAGYEEPLRTEFRAAASKWLDRVRSQFANALGDNTATTTQFFRAGDPVNREQEAFLYRRSVVEELEQQLLLATGCPGLVLYGRRRMGKSSVLKNLIGFLPPSVPVAYVSMQSPLASASLSDWCQTIQEAVQTAINPDNITEQTCEDLPGLMHSLNEWNKQLGAQNRRLMIAIDEYEMIDAKIGEGVFPIDLLAMLRESIQSHRHLTWVLAGSHQIDELTHAEWASYLVSARTVRVESFTLEETRELLTNPMKHSRLWRDADSRPKFGPELWGEAGIARIHADSGGWPHLVQLLAEISVDLVNSEGTRPVTEEMHRRVITKAIERGDTVLSQLIINESRLPGELDYLSAFELKDTQPPPADAIIRRSLQRRRLIEEINGEWRMRVPLMQEWLRRRG